MSKRKYAIDYYITDIFMYICWTEQCFVMPIIVLFIKVRCLEIQLFQYKYFSLQ